MELGVEFIGLDQWRDLVKTFADVSIKELEAACFISANQMKNDWNANIVSTQAVGASSEYGRSVIVDQSTVDGRVVSDCRSTAPHAVFVEYGTSPGWGARNPARKMPPPEALKTWVARKMIGFGRSRKKGGAGAWGRKGSNRRNQQEAEVDSAAFALALHIKQFGTPPKPCFEPAYALADGNFTRNLDEAYQRAETQAKAVGGAR